MGKSKAFPVAFGGLTAALAVVIMSIGTLIPFATFVCPVLCIFIAHLVLRLCGRKICVAWYLAAAVLSLLFSADKEAALLFLLLGYYPAVRTFISNKALGVLWKLVFVNFNLLLLYGLLIRLMGLEEIILQMNEAGAVGAIILLLGGNAVFLLLDRLLQRIDGRFFSHDR